MRNNIFEIENRLDIQREYDNSLYNSIQTIVNEMGINHPIN